MSISIEAELDSLKASPFPHLLLLIDDPSPVVQSEVRRALLPMAKEIAELLKIFPATAEQLQALNDLLFSWRKSQLLSEWPHWRRVSHPIERLEAFHSLLCSFQYRWSERIGLSTRLDELAERFRDKASLERLPVGLFEGLTGDRSDYHDPANSFLCEVLRKGSGNPISLCCILMLVGHRLGLDFRGCSFPGHFLARFESNQRIVLVDCFSGGRLLGPELTPELVGEMPPLAVQEWVSRVARVEEIAIRVLRNLVVACIHREQHGEAALFDLLAKDLHARGKGRGANLPLREPLFAPGQTVRHRRKDYRGVVVDYELYSPEEAKPHLPVYSILVHGSPQISSADEEQLEADEGLVAHQLVGLFFSRFEKGRYLRNSRPWEGGP